MDKKEGRTLAALAIGGGVIWLLTRQTAQAESQVRVGSIILDRDTGKWYIFGIDNQIHEILDPSILTSTQVNNSIQLSNSEISNFEEGSAFVCL